MRKGKIDSKIACLFFLFSLSSFFFSSFLHAQNSEEPRFIQRLTWPGDEYARRYEVVIEEEVEGTYREILRESSTELFIEVSLMPGKYRCRMIPHNFLDQPGSASEWKYIEVLAAFNPVLDDTLPVFLVSDTDLGSGVLLYEIRVSGKNLIPGAEIFLRGSNGRPIVPFEIQTDNDGTHIRLFFKKDQLVTGNYELIVINPGGLQAGRSGISFPPPEPIKPADVKVNIFLSTAWIPSFPAYDKESFFGQNLSLGGVVGRFGVIWTKPNYFKPGLELGVSYNFFGSSTGGQNAAHQGAFHLLAFTLNLSALKWLPGDRIALTFRLGAGYSLLLPNDGGAFHVNMCVSFLLFIMGHWYLETGLDYANWFTIPHSNCFRPWLGMGWRF